MMQQLTASYLPATKQNFHVTFSTNEFRNAIEEHTGQEVPASLVFEWLRANGYRSDDFGGMNLVWLMAHKEPARPFPFADNMPASNHEAD